MVSASIKLITAQPNIINTGSILYISLPIINVGHDAAANVFISKISLEIVPLLTPQVFPIYLGNLSYQNMNSVNVQFSAINIFPNQKYLLNVRGFYGERTSPIGFSVNRYVTIPAQTAYPVDMLKAHIDVKLDPMTWSYTIFNDEPNDSQQCIFAVSLKLVAPVTVTGIPSGWNVETDNLTYVGWYSEDTSKPYPSHVRPGDSLSGFQLKSTATDSESTGCLLISWKKDTDEVGLGIPVYVATPRRLV